MYRSDPNVRTVLRMLLVIPVASAAVQKANSTQVCKIGFEKHNGICMGSERSHPASHTAGEPLNYGSIIDSYAKAHPHRMLLSHGQLLAEQTLCAFRYLTNTST